MTYIPNTYAKAIVADMKSKIKLNKLITMKANELKIGNYVYFKHNDYDKNTPRKINYTKNPNEVGLDGVFQNKIEYSKLEPIKLTNDILIKFNFYTTDWDDNTSYRIRIGEHYVLVINLEFETYQLGDLDLRPINYVHELQNLYFSLTSNELDCDNFIKK